MAKEFFDRKSLVTTEGSLDLIRKSIQESVKFDAYGGNDVFQAIVISTAKVLTVVEGASHGVATKPKSLQQAQGVNYVFQVRILGENSPHKFLPDPLDPDFQHSAAATTQNGTNYMDSVVSLHTKVKAMFNLNIAPPTKGDIVEIKLARDGINGSFNMQSAEFVRGSSGQGSGGSNFNESGGFQMVNNFSYMEEGGGVPGQQPAGGTKDDPTFSKCKPSIYPDLPRKPTKFLTYSRTQVMDALNASITNENLKKTMWAFLNKEQPGFKFPANNVAGIQLDNKIGFRGAKKSDFDYQTCFLDSGNDQRIFAGFDTLEKGLVAFSKIIGAKMSSGYKKLSGNIPAQAEFLTWNYYYSWNTRMSKTELVQLKATGRVVKDGQVIERDWNSTTEQFKNSLYDLSPAVTDDFSESDSGDDTGDYGEYAESEA